MNILEVFNSFQTQEQAIEYLERIRWRGRPVCPYCNSESVHRHASGDRAMMRWQCQGCTRAFAATVGTIFHGTHVELRQWFLLIALMLNAKKSASACQIARDLGMRRPTVWSMMHRVRVAMANDPQQTKLLYGIVEADETYIGGKPRKPNRRDNDKPNKRGRGTKKTAVIGVVERGGRVIARPAKPGELSTKGLSKFINKFVDNAGTLVITDEFGGYRHVNKSQLHATVNHAVEYANGLVHTNTIEGFWSLVKRAGYGQHHHACFKYNLRNQPNEFRTALDVMVAA
ncbi:MAG: IS1595 family transposase [Nitrospira sp.]|nr:IS1595 family transposase [Nitrospira sp.]